MEITNIAKLDGADAEDVESEFGKRRGRKLRIRSEMELPSFRENWIPLAKVRAARRVFADGSRGGSGSSGFSSSMTGGVFIESKIEGWESGCVF
jgi:hypothetical protein